MAIATINPTTGETLTTFEPLTDAQLEDRLSRAAAAFASYRRTTYEQRAGWLRAAADVLDEGTDTLAELMTTEMGKTLKAARAEIGKCAGACRYYAEHGAAMLADEPVDAAAVKATKAFVRWQPLGPVLAVMPWNFPMWQAMRFAAPALMAGNVGLLKHASNVPQTALWMEELFRRAGFPDDVFQTLLVGSDKVEQILRDDRVAAATLTGSTPAGRSVAAIAGDALKPTVLELGGSDPFVVMPSADLERAARVAATARCQNNGQSCIAAKRFIVHADVAERFGELFAAALGGLAVGDPMDDATDVGPLATEQGRQDVTELVDDAVAKGARVVVGGEVPDRAGWFYPPTLLTGVTEDMRMFREEVFGPVAQLHVVPDLDEAIRLANDTDFGLGSNAWTNEPEEQERFATELNAGMVFINGMTASYPELPFGGVKASGYGRELSGLGIREFCNAKTVWVGEKLTQHLSLRTARRIALAAQGFAEPRPAGPATRRHLQRVVARTGLLQIDSVNVFERAHHLPLFSRLGPYDRQLLHRSAYVHRDLFEYWGHEASLLPVATQPLLRWRMERAAAGEEGWGRTVRVLREHPDFVQHLLERIRQEGPCSAGDLHVGERPAGPWWDWSLTKVALEHLFWAGRVTTADRRGFERVYDLPERVLPAAVLAQQTPSREDAQRELVRIAARAHGVAAERDLRDYFRLRVDEARAAVRSLVEAGELLPVEVEGWRGPAYLWPGSRVPRRARASALLSPFDPLVWERSRTARLFGFDYRIEIYVPAAKRVHGYYVLPFLHDEAVRARVDLKSDRKAGVLRVLASWLEPGSDPAEVAQALAGELRLAAQWQGLGDVAVEPRGDLAPALAAALP